MKYSNGDSYTGKIVRGVRSGLGATTYKNGVIFDGEWVLDIQHGKGRLSLPNGDHVEGEWNHGSCAHGTGRHTASDGSVYTGQLSAMAKHPLEPGKAGTHRGEVEIDFNFDYFNKGVCEYADGAKYQGDWRASQPNGQGAIIHPDGNFFEGLWRSGKPQRGMGCIISEKGGWEFEGGILRAMRHGEGTCKWPAIGMRYDGEWVNDRRSGRGKSVTEHDGHYAGYDGLWEDDMRCGQGEMFWPCGSSYVGEWKQDHPHGRGQAMFARDGSIFEGEFDPGPIRPGKRGEDVAGGMPCGRGRLEFPWGDVYVGQVVNGRPQGMGKLSTPNGDFVEGPFLDGFPNANCNGRRSFDDGSVFTGDLSGWMPHGLGKLLFADSGGDSGGFFYSGPFVDGEPSGKGAFVKIECDSAGEQHEVVVYEGLFREGQPEGCCPKWSFPPNASPSGLKA